MKKYLTSNLAITFCIAICVFIFSSCKQENENLPETSKFLASKSQLLSMSPEEQKQAWIVRLDLYLGMDLSQPQKSLIREMQADIKELEKGKFFLSENLRQSAISMAKITPREDFIALFAEAKETLPILRKTGTPCLECLADLEKQVGSNENNGNDSVTLRAANCDCLWTCQQQEDNLLCNDGYYATTLSPCSGGQTSGCCNQTTSGCGFFFTQSCTGLASCEPI